ncbi:MAG: response regulator [Alphaproteobacteria bacterium]
MTTANDVTPLRIERSAYQFSAVRALIAQKETALRTGLRSALSDWGFRNLVSTGQMQEAIGVLQSPEIPDVVLIDSDLSGGEVTELIREVRYSRLGDNPFIVAIGIIRNPTPDRVRQMVNSGVDFLVTWPVSSHAIWARVMASIEQRKKFVVVSDYIGPDRRETPRQDESRFGLDVPNTFRDKVLGHWDQITVSRQIQSAKVEVLSRRAARLSFRILVLAELMRRSFSAGALDPAAAALAELADRLGEFRRDIHFSRFPHVHSLAQSLERTSVWIAQSGGQPHPLDLSLASETAMELVLSVEPGRTIIDVRQEAAESLKQIRAH